MLKSSGNILLISENEVRLGEIRAQLSPHFNVFTAVNSREAYRYLTDFDMHVVLSEERMKDMTAIQFFESIKPEFPNIVSVVKANSSDLSVLRQAAQTGKIDQFLRVEADFDDMFQTLHSAIKQAELLDKNRVLSKQLKTQTKEQQRILELFNKYVPQQVVEQTLSYEENEILQGETRVVSVLFADIRNFSRIASTANPADVVTFLNDFWSALGEPVKMNHGSVNKLIGDGMLALFGAPVSHIHNQQNAVNCGLEMIKSLKQINEKYESILGMEIKIGVGINTGEVLVGNIGTLDHMEYTVIGDAVNVASRIESKTKNSPNSILISEATLEFLDQQFETEKADSLIMEGKSEPIELYKVLGRKNTNINPIRKGLQS
ncbi:MAG: adenylate/guanylate cyclase domain-containing protein [Balneolaceae bacterium]